MCNWSAGLVNFDFIILIMLNVFTYVRKIYWVISFYVYRPPALNSAYKIHHLLYIDII
jgi:hypothetical protein